MKLVLTADVRLGCIKSRSGQVTTDVVAFKKGHVFKVVSANIGDNKKQHVVDFCDVRWQDFWQDDDWVFTACFGTNHYPRSTWMLIPETDFEKSLLESHDLLL